MDIVNTLPLNTPTQKPNFPNPARFLPLKTVLPINPSKLYKIAEPPFCLSKVQTPTKSSLSLICCIPNSKLSKKDKNLTMLLTEKVLSCLLGTFIVMGSLGFNSRLSLAMATPAKASTFSEDSEEKRDTQVGKSEEEEMYEKLLEKEHRNLEALKVVVQMKMRRGQTAEAVKYVERLIDIEPEEVEWRLLEALCYEMMGKLRKAKSLFEDILIERPLLLRALHGLAMVMHKSGEGSAVFEMLNKALYVAHQGKRVTEERNIRFLIAQLHVIQGDLEEGLKKFQDLINENPLDFRPYLFQGIIYSLLDQKKEAAEHFETYKSLVPDEFPQRRFLDDVVLAAKRKSQEVLQKEFEAEFSYKK